MRYSGAIRRETERSLDFVTNTNGFQYIICMVHRQDLLLIGSEESVTTKRYKRNFDGPPRRLLGHAVHRVG